MSGADAARGAISRAEWRWVAGASFFVLVLAAALNVYGYSTAGDFEFTGLVYNWQDGNSYLAKMRQGVRGEWLYTVPFSADPGDGVLVYPHYLALGHIARALNVEPVLVFHASRLASGAVLLGALYGFIALLTADVNLRRTAFLLAATGSGLGWLALLLGRLTPDIWQAEIYPFLSILSNPHFPLAMAAMLWVLHALLVDSDKQGQLRLVVGTLVLAITQPYGLINLAAAVSPLWARLAWRTRRLPQPLTKRLVAVFLIAAPIVLYTQWAVLNSPALVAWDRQNLTTSPAPWDYAIALGIVLPLALAGGLQVVRERDRIGVLVVSWAVTSLILMYLPYYLQQRRFAFGLFVPLAILSVRGVESIGALAHPIWRAALVGASSLTGLIVLLLAYSAIQTHAPYLYFTRAEWDGLLYLRTNAPQRSLILTSPDFGLYVPAWSGQRVIYGHPHETGNARARATEVQAFFADNAANVDSFLKPVDYIFIGPRERALGTPQIPAPFAPVFVDGDVIIYARR